MMYHRYGQYNALEQSKQVQVFPYHSNTSCVRTPSGRRCGLAHYVICTLQFYALKFLHLMF